VLVEGIVGNPLDLGTRDLMGWISAKPEVLLRMLEVEQE